MSTPDETIALRQLLERAIVLLRKVRLDFSITQPMRNEVTAFLAGHDCGRLHARPRFGRGAEER